MLCRVVSQPCLTPQLKKEGEGERKRGKKKTKEERTTLNPRAIFTVLKYTPDQVQVGQMGRSGSGGRHYFGAALSQGRDTIPSRIKK